MLMELRHFFSSLLFRTAQIASIAYNMLWDQLSVDEVEFFFFFLTLCVTSIQKSDSVHVNVNNIQTIHQ